ncbi:MAG: peptidase dimerization domain-containing protein, partial [Bacteroidia bacterium]|nr:peptidase dimerization domain-containing protein [Bacteroidia bacterium]
DIGSIQQHRFDKVSELLGPTKATVTQINSDTQHNVIPDLCEYVVDVRTNELYTNEEVADLLNDLIEGTVTPRSTRLNSSKMDLDHPVLQAAQRLHIDLVGSPTLSDQALMKFPTIKMGPGDSPRSHTADEFIYLSEIEEGISAYIKLLQEIKIN